MIAEYTRYYGEVRGEMAWPMFLMLASRTDQFETRTQLTFFDAARSAIGAAFAGESGAGEVERVREIMVRLAYPSRGKATPEFTTNVLADG